MGITLTYYDIIEHRDYLETKKSKYGPSVNGAKQQQQQYLLKSQNMEPVKQQSMAEAQMEHALLAQIKHLLPEGYNIPQDVNQFELIMATIQYINALQSLTAQYH